MTDQTTPPLDLPALKEIANAANTGPWESKQGAISPGKKVVGPREARDIGRGPIVIMQPIFWDKRSAVNADHIAAFDPPTVLALIAHLKLAEDRIASVRELASPDWCLSVPAGVKQAILARLGEAQ